MSEGNGDQRSTSPISTLRGLSQGARAGFRHREAFGEVEKYCSFVGYSRSGSTLVGSLLDAHPDVVIAQEVHALKLVHARVPKQLLFGLILSEEQRFTAEGRTWTGYRYQVPKQWQGRYRRLRVIGDKKAGRTINRFRRYPHLLERLRSTVGVPLRFVHVTRNPFDNIATMAYRSAEPLEAAVQLYFQLADAVVTLDQKLAPEELITVRHEDLLREPRHVLSGLCEFLDLEADQQYLDDCASIVNAAPHRSRSETSWPPQLLADVQAKIDRVPLLAGYSFDN